MSAYDYAVETDEISEDYDSDDSFVESDESDEIAERRGWRSRRPPRIAPGRLAKPGGLVRPPAPVGKMVTRAEFNAGMARVDKKIELSTEAIKKVTAQANKATADLGASTSRLDKQTGELKKEVKRQGDTSLLLTLLNKPPALKPTTQKVLANAPGSTTPVEVEVVSKVEYDKQSNLCPCSSSLKVAAAGSAAATARTCSSWPSRSPARSDRSQFPSRKEEEACRSIYSPLRRQRCSSKTRRPLGPQDSTPIALVAAMHSNPMVALFVGQAMAQKKAAELAAATPAPVLTPAPAGAAVPVPTPTPTGAAAPFRRRPRRGRRP